jgi:hypothetical protein
VSCREKSQESRKNKIKNIGGVFTKMFSSNKKYKWLTFILKYGEDDHVKYLNINEKTFLEKTALSRKNKFYFCNFCSKRKYNIARILIRYF